MNKILCLALFMEKKTFYEIVVRGLLAKKDEWFFGIIIWIFEGKKRKVSHFRTKLLCVIASLAEISMGSIRSVTEIRNECPINGH